jgi:hypothetical protein
MTVTAELADGRRLEFPDGTDPAIVQATVKKMLAPSAAPATLPGDEIAGNPLTRFALGAASPFIGAAQLAANVLPDSIGKPVNEHIATLEAMKKSGMKAADNEGYDIAGMAGNLLSPATLATGGIGAAPTLAGRVGQGVAIGAGFGAATPVTDPQNGFWREKAAQTGTGALVGGIVPVGVEGAQKAYGLGKRLVEPLTTAGQARILDRYQQTLAGDKKAELIAALRNGREIVPGSVPTAGETMAEIPGSTGLAAHQRAVGMAPEVSGQFAQREAEQAAARQAALGTVAQTPQALEAALRNRAENAAANYGPIGANRINPASDTQIMADAITSRAASKASALQDAGRFATTEAQNNVRGNNFYPVEGMPRVPARVSNFPDRAAEAASAAADAAAIAKGRFAEESFLKSTMDLLKQTVGLGDKSLQDFLSRPSMQAAVKDAIKSAEETQSYFPTGGGKFSVDNLQRMKMALDDIVKDPKTFGLKATEQREVMGTRDAFVKWLSEKSPEWKAARLQYAEDSIPINQMQVGQQLKDKLAAPLDGTERARMFAQAMRDAPQTLKKATGFARYDDLSQVLNPNQLSTVQGVGADLAREAKYLANARGTNLQGANAVGTGAEVRLPNLLSRPAMIANALLKHFGKNADTEITKIAAGRYLDPKELAAALESMPIAQRSAMLDSLGLRGSAMASQLGAQQ